MGKDAEALSPERAKLGPRELATEACAGGEDPCACSSKPTCCRRRESFCILGAYRSCPQPTAWCAAAGP